MFIYDIMEIIKNFRGVLMSEKIEVGSIIEGKVIRIKPFGAIVLLPDNSQGLVHISHISTSFVQNIADHVAIGDIIKVKVLSLDAETSRISLSIKEAIDQPRRIQRDFDNNQNRQKPAADSVSQFEDKFKEWLKVSNERQAGLNKRNKRR